MDRRINELAKSSAAMILTQKNRSGWRKACSTITLSTTQSLWTGLLKTGPPWWKAGGWVC